MRLMLLPAVLALAATENYSGPIRETLSDYAVMATIGPAEIALPLELSNFLLDHPDFAARVVNSRKIAPYRVEMRGARQSWADDGRGTRGLVILAERSDTRRLYYGEGVHRSRLLPPIRATAVVAMELRPASGNACSPSTKTTFTVHVRLPSRLVAGVVKTLRPFLRRAVADKFAKAFLVAAQVGRLLARDPRSLDADVRQDPGLSPDDRARFLELTSRLAALQSACAAPAAQ